MKKQNFSDLEQTIKELQEELARCKVVLSELNSYQEAVENQPELICRWLPDTTLLFVNKAYAEFFALSRSELTGCKWMDFLPEEEKIKARQWIQELNVKQPDYCYEYYTLNNEDQKLWLSWINKAFFDEHGNLNYVLSVGRDITERKKAEAGLHQALQSARATESQLRAILEASRTILTIDDFSAAARKIFDNASGLIGSTAGYVALLSSDGQENELLFLESGGRPCKVNPELPMPIRGLRAESYRSNAVVYENDFMHSRWIQYMPQGHVRLDNIMFAPLVIDEKTVGIIGLANKPGGFDSQDAELAMAFGDLAALSLRNARTLEELQRLSRTDALTGCFNRRKFLECLDYECKRIERLQTSLTLIMFDIDNFKHINDTYGHEAGDLVLQSLAAIVSAHIREVDILCRWGGEEFLILAPDTDAQNAQVMVERIRKTVAEHVFSQDFEITVSFGLVQYKKGEESLDDLINRADQCMYLAKEKGRNRVEMC
ncbi:MAG: sensor domain-containing diguanylate cyclase [Desulfovermiculus sp.]|nr:sensor domain-containing diguanylate cyclase [Desulfovermiculus sp.]